MNNSKCPVIVTMAGWFLVITSALPIITGLLMLMMPYETRIGALRGMQISGHTPLTAAIFYPLLIICGLAVLKGLNWGRMLLLIAWPARFFVSFFIVPVQAAVPLAAMAAGGYLGIIMLFTNSEAAAYFRKD